MQCRALSLALVCSLFIMANKLTAFCLSYLTKDLFLLSSNPNKPEHSLYVRCFNVHLAGPVLDSHQCNPSGDCDGPDKVETNNYPKVI